MKQKNLIKHIFMACVEHDDKKLKKHRLEEFKKIFKRKRKGKPFDAKWTVVQL